MRIERSKRAGLGIAVGWICTVLAGLLAALAVPMAARGTLAPLAILVFGVGRAFVHLLAGSLWADFAFLKRGNQDRGPPHDWSKTGMDLPPATPRVGGRLIMPDILHRLLGPRPLVLFLCVLAGISSGWLSGGCAEAKTPFEGRYLPAWDIQCGHGRDVAQGCEKVRARDIVDASQYPWSAIGRVNFAGYRTRLHCTGALIGERAVLTAAHCLFDGIRKQWLLPENVHFRAGYQRGAHMAHSIAERYVLFRLHDTTSSRYELHPGTDWAVIELREPLGLEVGYLNWRVLDRHTFEESLLPGGGKIAFAGYSGLREHVLSVDMSCKDARFRESGYGAYIASDCAVMHGDSGGPLFFLENYELTVIGTLSSGWIENGEVVNAITPIGNIDDAVLEALGDAQHHGDGKAGN